MWEIISLVKKEMLFLFLEWPRTIIGLKRNGILLLLVCVGRHVGIFDELSQRRRWSLKEKKKKSKIRYQSAKLGMLLIWKFHCAPKNWRHLSGSIFFLLFFFFVCPVPLENFRQQISKLWSIVGSHFPTPDSSLTEPIQRARAPFVTYTSTLIRTYSTDYRVQTVQNNNTVKTTLEWTIDIVCFFHYAVRPFESVSRGESALLYGENLSGSFSWCMNKIQSGRLGGPLASLRYRVEFTRSSQVSSWLWSPFWWLRSVGLVRGRNTRRILIVNLTEGEKCGAGKRNLSRQTARQLRAAWHIHKRGKMS
jgi:hypothetical protein